MLGILLTFMLLFTHEKGDAGLDDRTNEVIDHLEYFSLEILVGQNEYLNGELGCFFFGTRLTRVPTGSAAPEILD